MTPELSIFAARLREHIASCADVCSLADEKFNALAVELFALQFNYNTSYRKLCEARSITPDLVSHWTQIPTVPTAALKEFEMTSLPPDQRTRVFYSSGTTEQRPSKHFHNAESLAVYEASLWQWFKQNCRLRIADCRLLSLTPTAEHAPHSSLVHMFDFVRGKLGADENAFVGRINSDGSWRVDFDAALVALSCSRRREKADFPFAGSPLPHVSGYEKPLLILGTAFGFVHLLDELSSRNLRLQLPEKSRVIETGGYKGRSRTMPKAELHALITEHLGVAASHILCEYGMSELSSQAYEGESLKSQVQSLKPCRSFHFPPWARVRIISPETGHEVSDGEIGLIQVFDLANVFSVMAIQTEDMAVRRGDGFELLGRATMAEPRGCSLTAA